MNIDDPKLTAYALGEMNELTGEERRAVEALIAESEEARTFVEETAAFAQALKAEFGAELPELQLGQIGRSELLSEVKAAQKVVPFTANRHWVWSFAGIAAAVVLVAFFLSQTLLDDISQSSVGADSRDAVPETLAMTADALISVETEESEGKAAKVAVVAPKLQNPSVGESRISGDSSERIRVEIDGGLAIASNGMVSKDTGPALSEALVRGLADLDTAQSQDRVNLPRPISAPSAIVTTAPSIGTKPVAMPALTPRPPSIPTESQMALNARQAKEIASFTGGWAKKKSDARISVASGNHQSYEFERRTRMLGDQADSNEAYLHHNENAFLSVGQHPLSTFSIDVDTASYSNVRRFLMAGRRPPVDAVRIEELLNYFRYDYAPPKGEVPFATHVEVAQCPWTPENRLVKIGLKGREIVKEKRAASNLVFLIDVSGSMSDDNKLPLLKQSMRLMVERLGEDDRVAIVVYASEAGVKLPPTRGHQKAEILAALEGLNASGGTNGGEGIQQAYAAATANFIPGGVNRVILATDGDFNVGTTSQAELTKLIETKAKSGVYLTVLGFGEGNLKDATMKALSTKGNGNYAYIDSLREGRKVLVEQLSGTLVTIAKDVKIQVEFNPAQVSAYRLIGYENRLLRKEDFNDDKKDAGEIGAGHTVTALYEVVPAGKPGAVDNLKYQPAPAPTSTTSKADATSSELLTVKLRYKKPDGETSQLIDQPVVDRGLTIKESSRDFRFAAAVAEFGMLLKRSPHAGLANWAAARELALDGIGEDEGGYRAEFIGLLEKAERLDGGRH